MDVIGDYDLCHCLMKGITMITRLGTFWERLRENFWFLPAIMILIAIALSVLIVGFDQRISFQQGETLHWIGTISPEGARSFLSTVAGSMISVAGVTFSITLVALAQTSSQYGPRLTSNFLRDRGNQIVLGTFVATFVYCILVLRTIRGTEELAFVPHIAVLVGVVLTVASVGVFVYFIHHISTSLKAENIIADIGHELDRAIARLFPEESSLEAYEHELRDEHDIPDNFEEQAIAIKASQSGYVQAIDYDHLEETAVENDLLLQLSCRAGNFIAKGDIIVRAWSDEQIDDDLTKSIGKAFITGSRRLQSQDIEYAIYQLVEVAVRSLSPSVNDPFTAVACIDQISASLAELAERKIPEGYYYDEAEKLRLVRDAITFTGILEAAFNKIRRYGRSNVDVVIRLLEALAIIAVRVHTSEQKEAVITQAHMIRRASEDNIPEPNDLEAIEARYRLVLNALETESQPD